MIKGEFEYQMELQKSVSTSPNVRTVIDTHREFEMFIYPFLIDDMLHFSQKELSMKARKEILRSALRGLADLHENNILHNGMLLLGLNRYTILILLQPITQPQCKGMTNEC